MKINSTSLGLVIGLNFYNKISFSYLRFFNFNSDGIIRLTAFYDYKQGQHPKEHLNEIPIEYKEVLEQENPENIKSIPSFLLFSDKIEINIKK